MKLRKKDALSVTRFNTLFLQNAISGFPTSKFIIRSFLLVLVCTILPKVIECKTPPYHIINILPIQKQTFKVDSLLKLKPKLDVLLFVVITYHIFIR